MARLPLKSSTIKRLFALSGNKCMFTDCKEEIVDYNGIVIGEICHIEAAEPLGERYNSTSNDEFRRSFENLILFCGKHHKVTNDTHKYTPNNLRLLKSIHEESYLKNKFRVSENTIEQVMTNYMKQENKNETSATQINNQAATLNINTQIGSQTVYNMSLQHSIDETIYNNSIRPINKILKQNIEKLKQAASPPKEDVIDFKNDLIIKRPSLIYELPVSELKFRKENGRIKADVESYEKLHGHLDDSKDETQNSIRDFLQKNDPEKKEILKQQIKHKGQLQPAIITCDGFLINGNRRKMILEELYRESHQDPKFENMRVIILPENVSVFDIKRIENRYQLQDEGKSEYLGLNRALTIRDNIKDGYSLRAQILDDPQYSEKQGKDLEAVVRDFEKKYLNPLACVDRYLKTFNREGLYNTISESTGDKEGRWQAFIDYSTVYYGTLENKNKQIEYKIKEAEIRKIENAIFKIIRKRSLNSKELESTIGKVHDFVRKSPKYIKNLESKKFLLKIAEEVGEDIPEKEKLDKDGNPYDAREIDEKWGNLYKNEILGNLIKAHKIVLSQIERDKPLELLEDALKKLKHENLKIENMDNSYYESAMELTKEISSEADNIFHAIDGARYKLKKLLKQGK
jgi:hypothetical protein